MTNKRPLTNEKRLLAANLKRVWLSKKSALGLTQEKVALAWGWTQGNITQYLNGHIPLNTDTVNKFANLLGVDPSEIDTLGSSNVVSISGSSPIINFGTVLDANEAVTPVESIADIGNNIDATRFILPPSHSNKKGVTSFGLRMPDNSMHCPGDDVSIPSGGLITCESLIPDNIPPGKVVIAHMDDADAVIVSISF